MKQKFLAHKPNGESITCIPWEAIEEDCDVDQTLVEHYENIIGRGLAPAKFRRAIVNNPSQFLVPHSLLNSYASMAPDLGECHCRPHLQRYYNIPPFFTNIRGFVEAMSRKLFAKQCKETGQIRVLDIGSGRLYQTLVLLANLVEMGCVDINLIISDISFVDSEFTDQSCSTLNSVHYFLDIMSRLGIGIKTGKFGSDTVCLGTFMKGCIQGSSCLETKHSICHAPSSANVRINLFGDVNTIPDGFLKKVDTAYAIDVNKEVLYSFLNKKQSVFQEGTRVFEAPKADDTDFPTARCLQKTAGRFVDTQSFKYSFGQQFNSSFAYYGISSISAALLKTILPPSFAKALAYIPYALLNFWNGSYLRLLELPIQLFLQFYTTRWVKQGYMHWICAALITNIIPFVTLLLTLFPLNNIPALIVILVAKLLANLLSLLLVKISFNNLLLGLSYIPAYFYNKRVSQEKLTFEEEGFCESCKTHHKKPSIETIQSIAKVFTSPLLSNYNYNLFQQNWTIKIISDNLSLFIVNAELRLRDIAQLIYKHTKYNLCPCNCAGALFAKKRCVSIDERSLNSEIKACMSAHRARIN